MSHLVFPEVPPPEELLASLIERRDKMIKDSYEYIEAIISTYMHPVEFARCKGVEVSIFNKCVMRFARKYKIRYYESKSETQYVYFPFEPTDVEFMELQPYDPFYEYEESC